MAWASSSNVLWQLPLGRIPSVFHCKEAQVMTRYTADESWDVSAETDASETWSQKVEDKGYGDRYGLSF